MQKLSDNALLNLSIDISWTYDKIDSRDHSFIHHLNAWRDILPGSMLEKVIMESEDGVNQINVGPS